MQVEVSFHNLVNVIDLHYEDAPQLAKSFLNI